MPLKFLLRTVAIPKIGGKAHGPDLVATVVKQQRCRYQDGDHRPVFRPKDTVNPETVPPRLRISRNTSFAAASPP